MASHSRMAVVSVRREGGRETSLIVRGNVLVEQRLTGQRVFLVHENMLLRLFLDCVAINIFSRLSFVHFLFIVLLDIVT